MTEFRQNLTSKEWVIVAPANDGQLINFRKGRAITVSYDENCPFCPGNEKLTGEALYEIPQQGRWKVRVVPDNYGPLGSEFTVKDLSADPLKSASADGILSEVIVESPEHNKSLALLQLGDVASILEIFKQRYKLMSRRNDIGLITIFGNHGKGAGASLAHPHSRILATPVIPAYISHQNEQSARYYHQYGQCLHCFMIGRERAAKERMIIDTDNFVAFCPFAARNPFEIAVYPKRHMADFHLINNGELEELSWVLQTTMLKLFNCLDDPDYNYVLRSAPLGIEDNRHLHWHIEIIPRITVSHGFALGAGLDVNEVAPEKSARYLREIGTDC